MIEGTKISITRGDAGPVRFTFTGDDVPEDGTDILFTVKKNSEYDKALIEKRVPVQGGQMEIFFHNEDTRSLPFGNYEWDIRLPDYYGTKEPYTPMIAPQIFEVTRVVGNVK